RGTTGEYARPLSAARVDQGVPPRGLRISLPGDGDRPDGQAVDLSGTGHPQDAARLFVRVLPAGDDLARAAGGGAVRGGVHGGRAGPAFGAGGGQGVGDLVSPRGAAAARGVAPRGETDRKSTRLNSSHVEI